MVVAAVAAVAAGAAWFGYRHPVAVTAPITRTPNLEVSEELIEIRSADELNLLPRRSKPCAGCPGKQGKIEPDTALSQTAPLWRPTESMAERILGHAADAPLPASTHTTLLISAIPKMGHGFVVTSWGPQGAQQDWRLNVGGGEKFSVTSVVEGKLPSSTDLWLEVGGRLRQLFRMLHGETWQLGAVINGFRVVTLADATAILAYEAAPEGGWERVHLDLDPDGRITRVSWAQWDPAQEQAWRCLVTLVSGPSLVPQEPE